jgi:hypothetical protein
MAMALVYMVFFAFNKQAFCNYYFLVLSLMCMAIPVLVEPDAMVFDSDKTEIGALEGNIGAAQL